MCSQSFISIVTPSFNQSTFLEETLYSIIRQDYAQIEHIVIDGGSTDGSVEIIRRHENHLAYWISEPDEGQSSAINKGFAKATGDILAWLNSDDLLAPSAVRIATDYLKNYPEVGLVFGDRLHIDSKGNVIGINRAPQYYPTMLRHNITLPQETVFFRRDVWERVGELDESLHFAMDFDFWCRVAKVTTFKHIPAFLGSFREHPAAKSVVANDQMDENAAAFLKEHQRVYRKHFGCGLPGLWAAKWHRLLHIARFAKECAGERRAAEVRRIRALMAARPPAVTA